MIIDTHCHLYLKNFSNDLEQVLERAVKKDVLRLLLPAIDSETHEQLLQLAERPIPGEATGLQVLPMMGLHPCSVKENFEQELSIALNYLDDGRKYYAVGEIGLDYYWDVTFKAQQVIAFEQQIEWSIERNLPIVIHSRNSTADCIKSVQKYAGKAKGVFHCFSGTTEDIKQVKDLGFYMGIGGVVTYKNGGLKEVLNEIGLENMVLETDAPYLTPVPHRGKRNESSYLEYVCETIATELKLTYQEVEEQTTLNAKKLFELE